MKPLDELRDEMAEEHANYSVYEMSNRNSFMIGWDACRRVCEERDKVLLEAMSWIIGHSTVSRNGIDSCLARGSRSEI